MITIEPYYPRYLEGAMKIWNQVVSDGIAFPQVDLLNEEDAGLFFSSQTFTGIAVDGDSVLGLYILHPNNVGRCEHVANCSYAVARGMCAENTSERCWSIILSK